MDQKVVEAYDQMAAAKKAEIAKEGVWVAEPNFLSWNRLELTCMVIRNGEMLHLCGYVGVDPKHILYGKTELDVSVHGGLTFTGIIKELDPEMWWFGFDCAHFSDAIPAFKDNEQQSYKDMVFVKSETDNLCEQIANIGIRTQQK